ncbi:MAG: hypothetical protein ACHQ49_02665 [Elusimicrobiota bacterium]
MADLTVRLELSFGARSLRCLMASAMMFAAVSEVASESVTLTTYYPAPSGVYLQMIVTGNTYLARDQALNYPSQVGIGVNSFTAGIAPYFMQSYDMLNLYNANSHDYLRIGAPIGFQSSIAFDDATNGEDAVILRPQATRDFALWNSNAGYVMYMPYGTPGNPTTSGKVGFGTTAPAATVEVDGREVGTPAVRIVPASPTDTSLQVDGYIQTQGAANPNTGLQGAYLSWNSMTGGAGETDLINNRGGGYGGFAFLDSGYVHSNSNPDAKMYIDPSGGSLTTIQTNCASVNVVPNSSALYDAAGNPAAPCSGYLTTVSGVYADKVTLPYANFTTQGTVASADADTGAPNTQYVIDALCCPCPASGCNL